MSELPSKEQVCAVCAQPWALGHRCKPTPISAEDQCGKLCSFDVKTGRLLSVDPRCTVHAVEPAPASKEWFTPWKASGFAVYDTRGQLVVHVGITGNRSMPGAQLERMAEMIADVVNRAAAEPKPNCEHEQAAIVCADCGVTMCEPRNTTPPGAATCETCPRPLPPLAEWSMPSCPQCVEAADSLLDAERYRWLRRHVAPSILERVTSTPKSLIADKRPEALDAEVDLRIAGKVGAGIGPTKEAAP